MSNNKKILIIVCFVLIAFYCIFKLNEYNDNDRYLPVVVPYERTYGTTDGGKREDKFYILDTRTGDYRKVGSY